MHGGSFTSLVCTLQRGESGMSGSPAAPQRPVVVLRAPQWSLSLLCEHIYQLPAAAASKRP